MKCILLPLVSVLFATLVTPNVFGQKVLRDFRMLESPRADSEIVGREQQDLSTFTGPGTKSVIRKPSYSEFSKTEARKSEVAIAAAIKKLIVANLSLTDTLFRVTLANGLTIVECTDYTELDGLNQDRRYVISAVVAKEFSITRDSDFSAGLKAQLVDSSKLSVAFDSAKISVSFDNRVGVFRSGTDLVFAIKTIRVTKAEPIYLSNRNDHVSMSLSLPSNNSADLIDFKPMKGLLSVQFTSLEPITEDLVGIGLISKHVGCIRMAWTHSIYQSAYKAFVICPDCASEIVQSSPHPDCQKYRPKAEFQTSNQFDVIRRKVTKNTIAIYRAKVQNLKVDFSRTPDESPDSNYGPRGGGVTCDIVISRILFTIRND